jgi:hypothetical protein
MPQVKELKELTLLVSNAVEKGRYGRVAFQGKSLPAVSAAFFVLSRGKHVPSEDDREVLTCR